MTIKDERFHVVFADNAAEETLGLLLRETQQLGLSRHLINPYAAKGSSGYTQDSDLTEWSVVAQTDWRGGRGQEEHLEDEKFLDARGLETRIEGQITLGPLPHQQVAPAASGARYEPGSATPFGLGEPAVIHSGASGEDEPLRAGVTAAMSFRTSVFYSDFPLKVREIAVRIKKAAGATVAVRLDLYSSDSDGLPNTSLANKTVAAGSVSTVYSYITFTLDTPVAVTADTVYWIVVYSPDTVGTDKNYYWSRTPVGVTSTEGAGYTTGEGWFSVHKNFAYAVWWSKISRSMSFDAPTGGMTCNLVQLYLCNRGMHPWYDGLTISLCADSSGSPGTVLKTTDIYVNAVSDSWAWVEVEWATGQALTSETTYHITVEPATITAGLTIGVKEAYMLWGGNPDGGYSDGASDLKIDSGSWSAKTEDLYFRIKRDVLEDSVVAFARYDGGWYCAAGDTVYKWNTGTKVWDSSDCVTGKDVTDLLAWGEYLWAARGSGSIMRRLSGTWANVTGKFANYLAGGSYFHYSDASSTNTHKVYYTNDGTNWYGPISCGTQQYGITGLAWFRDRLVAATSVRLWTVVTANDGVYPTLDWSSQEDSNNGKSMLVWGRTGALYIPLRFGLFRYNGDTMVPVGPEQGTGLPAVRAGKIVKMVGTGNWLFAAIDAGDDGTSSILAYNGLGGWHEMARAEVVGQRIYTLGFETISSPSRLWYGLDKETRYLKLPDYSDNPWEYTGYKYNAGGNIITSWMGGNLLEVVKDLYSVTIRAENVSSSRPIVVYYEIDRSGEWQILGEVTEAPRQKLSFEASAFGSRTIGSSSTRTTIELATGNLTTGMNVGDWCRINAEVSQIATITDSNTFVLETALSEAPASGDTVYASPPAGREFRLKIVMSSDDEDETPKLKTVFIQYQNNVADRFGYTLQIKVEDNMQDLSGNPYPYTAADLRLLLDEWAKRVLPFSFLDQDGEEVTVKIAAASEGGYTRDFVEGVGSRYTSTYSINLVQVT